MIYYILNINHNHCQAFVWSYEPQASSSVEFSNDCGVIFMFKIVEHRHAWNKCVLNECTKNMVHHYVATVHGYG